MVQNRRYFMDQLKCTNPNIALDESIDICVKKLFKTLDTLVKGISKNDFRDLLNLATKESFFTFNNKFYIELDGVAMGSPLGPIMANIFLSHHEENWLNKCPMKFKPRFCRRYLMIFLYFLNHLNLLIRFAKTVNLSLVFT